MLETERLLFRRYTDDDLDFLTSMLTDPLMVRYIGHGQIRTREEIRAFLDRILGHYAAGKGTGLMLAVQKQDGQPVGHVGLVPQQVEGRDEMEVGYWIARAHWGKGLASEAASAFLAYGRETLGLPRLVSLIHPANAASIGVAKKIGMSFERMVTFRGRDVCLYAAGETAS
ncbi:GNAT family N-acetyltransferase [Brevibacillus sp. SYP-B805]|uniref:GNAT family N-acetyltransferase n=1 Tax=Brevibacillus sp. SYP-B805 TaxID=1578199 RepID=UPI0013E9E962|nr:GNAT family N-acetyltransferase [Brevibacillus sp. SYP-B805]